MLEGMNLVILFSAGLVALSVLTSLISYRIGAPLLLLFLLLGLAVGENGLGLEFDDAPIAYLVGSTALAIILFDSGFGTDMRTLRAGIGPALVLATLGVVFTALITALGAWLLFGFGWIQALLMGSIVASTDAAAVFFLLRAGGITLRERIRATLEIESGSNDPMAIFMTLTLVLLLSGEAAFANPAAALATTFVLQFGLGVAAGLLGGWLIVRLLNHLELEPALYPLIALSLALLLFAGVNMVGGSGFLAAYIAGLVTGNAGLRQARTLMRFQEGITWLAQITMFLTLGLLATPAEFVDIALPAVLLGLVMILVARPLAVALCLWPFGFSRQETAFVGWVGLRGAVSILLAILPLLHDVPEGQAIFNATFLIVLVSLVAQGWTIRPAARLLGMVVPSPMGPIDRIDLELPGTARLELAVYHILPGSPVARGRRLPRWARPALIIREGRRLDIHGAGRLQPDDYVYIFTAPEHVRLLDRLFATTRDLGADDREIFGDFALAPDTRLGQVARAYGFAAPSGDSDLTLRTLLERELPSPYELGDRRSYGPVDLIVRGLDDSGRITVVGLALEHRPAASRLPDLLGRWLGSRRAT